MLENRETMLQMFPELFARIRVQPDSQVAGFVRATIKGTLDTIRDPGAAIKSVMKRNETGDEAIELGLFNAPLAPTTDLDGAQLTGAYQRVGLRRGDAQDVRDVGEGEKASRHLPSLTPQGAV